MLLGKHYLQGMEPVIRAEVKSGFTVPCSGRSEK